MKITKTLLITLAAFVLVSCNTDGSSTLISTLDSSSSSVFSSSQLPRPVEDTDDNSLLVTTKTLIKLPVPEPTGDTYLIPNSEITITAGQVYTDLNEVAAYVIAFKALPVNYFYKGDKKTCQADYGEDCRLIGSLIYHNDPADGYSSPILTDGATNYHEADVGDYQGKYTSNSRGMYRIVYSVDPGHEIVYFTDCHYENYSEYYNYYNGFGPWWGNGKLASHPEAKPYQKPVIGYLDFSVPYPQN